MTRDPSPASYRVLPPITPGPWTELPDVRLPDAEQAEGYAEHLLQALSHAHHVQILPDQRPASHTWRNGRLMELHAAGSSAPSQKRA